MPDIWAIPSFVKIPTKVSKFNEPFVLLEEEKEPDVSEPLENCYISTVYWPLKKKPLLFAARFEVIIMVG